MVNEKIKVFDYGLHDCRISSAIIDENCLWFKFDSGLYILNIFGKEQEKTKACSIKIDFEDFVRSPFVSCFEIRKFYRRKVSEIGINRFVKLVNNFGFVIDNHFYSEFNNGLLIRGFLGKGYGAYEMLISDIKSFQVIDL